MGSLQKNEVLKEEVNLQGAFLTPSEGRASELTNILKVLEGIEDIKIKKINIGNSSQNYIKIHLTNPNNYGKWNYFCKMFDNYLGAYRIALKRNFPEMTFIFPNNTSNLISSIHELNSFLGRKFYLIEEPHQECLTVIAKVTNLCNIDCKYCYDRPFRECLGHNGIIQMERIKHLIDMAAKYAREVTMVWHGGEPTLAGVKFYEDLTDYMFNKHPYTTWRQSMQSNGTLFDEEWFRLSERCNIALGSSYNATSTDLRHTQEDNELGGEGHTIDNVLQNVKNGSRLGIGVIDVLTKKNHKDVIDIYEFYKKEGVSAVFNEILNAGEAEKHDFLFITPEETRQYLKTTTEYYKYWLTDKSKECFDDRYTSLSIQMLFTGTAQACSFAGRCVGNWLGINSNGDLYPCDRALPEKYRFGNVMDFDSLEELYQGPVFMNYYAERERKKERCKTCFLNRFCNSSCPMEDIDENMTAAIKNKMACKMRLCNLFAAYKVLNDVTFDECNIHIQKFLLAKGGILPREIPQFLEMLGIADEIGPLNYSEETARFNNKEFKIFAIINSLYEEDMVHPDWGERISTFIRTPIEEIEDNRIVNMYTFMKEKAEKIINELSS